MRATASSLLACVVWMLPAACSGGSAKKAPPDASSFRADEPKEDRAATVFLRGRTAASDQVVVDVVARGLEQDLHGIAFRIHWDPNTLAFESASSSDAWSRRSLGGAREGAPGELVIAWTEKGGAPGLNARDETVLGTIELARRTNDAAALEFRTDRSRAQSASGAPLPVEWRGGRVDAR